MKAKNNKRFQYPVRTAKPGQTAKSEPTENTMPTVKSELVAKFRQATKLVESTNHRQTMNPKRTMDSKQIAKLVRTVKSRQTVKFGLAEQISRITKMEALFTKCEEAVRQLRQAIENKASIIPDLTNFTSVLKDFFDFKNLTSSPSFLNSPAQSFDLNDLTSAISILESYYTSPAWLSDFEADEAGLLPPDLKRGVLSEDGIYNLLEEYKRMGEEMKEIMGKM
jgi:hypothetical protein